MKTVLLLIFSFASSAVAAPSLVPTPARIKPNAGDHAICVLKIDASEQQIPYTPYGSYELELSTTVVIVTSHKVGNKILASANVLQEKGTDGVYTKSTSTGLFDLRKGHGTHLMTVNDGSSKHIFVLCTKK